MATEPSKLAKSSAEIIAYAGDFVILGRSLCSGIGQKNLVIGTPDGRKPHRTQVSPESGAVVAAASTPSPLSPPTADIAHSGHESQLLAMNGPSELAVRISALGRKADLRSQRLLFRRFRRLQP